MFAVYAKEANLENPLASLVGGERPGPVVKEGWVRVKMTHVSLNRHDVFTLRGLSAQEEAIPFPMILGNDGAGLLEDGTPVVIYPVMGTDRWKGDETIDPHWHIFSELVPGTMADYVAVPKAAVSTGDNARRRGHRSGRDVRRRGGRNRHRRGRQGQDGHGYVLADISGRYPPTEWARLAITAYATYGADRIVAEVNNGGDMVGATLRMIDPNVAFTAVRASRGKVVRAEPVAALYQQGRVHHIGTFPQLEDQMTNFTSDIDRAAAGYSPDRVDALVWAFSELLVEPMNGEGIFEFYRRNAEAAEQRDKPQPTITVYAPGSMEWLAEQKKSG